MAVSNFVILSCRPTAIALDFAVFFVLNNFLEGIYKIFIAFKSALVVLTRQDQRVVVVLFGTRIG